MKLIVSATDESLESPISINADRRRGAETTTETDCRGPTAGRARRLFKERQSRGSGVAVEHLKEAIRVARHIGLERIREPAQTKPVGPVDTARTGLPDVTDPVVS